MVGVAATTTAVVVGAEASDEPDAPEVGWTPDAVVEGEVVDEAGWPEDFEVTDAVVAVLPEAVEVTVCEG